MASLFLSAACLAGMASSSDPDAYSRLFMSDASEFTSVPAEVVGSRLPAWLQGKYIHNGCGLFGYGNRSFSHVFDCYGKLHKWEFGGSGVTFSSKLLTSHFYNESARTDTVMPQVFFGVESPRFDMKERIQAMMNAKPGKGMADNENVNLWDWGFADSVLALTDTDSYLKVDTDTLVAHPFNFENLDPASNGSMSPAHPQHVPDDSGDTLTFVIDSKNMLSGKSRITFVRQKKGSRHLEPFFSTDLSKLHYVHSFSVTENYMIVALYPSYMNEMCVMRSLTNHWGGMKDCFMWDSTIRTTVLVVSHKTGDLVTSTEVSPFFSFHHINAFESNDRVVLDLVAVSNSSIIQAEVFAAKAMMDPAARDASKSSWMPPRYYRLRIDLSPDSRESTVQDIRVQGPSGNNFYFEFPIVNPKVAAKKHCYVWGIAGPFAGGSKQYNASAMVKVDICSARSNTSNPVAPTVVYFPPINHYPSGDSSFIPNPDPGADEDDGIILGAYLNGDTLESYLRVFDAKTMDEVAVIKTDDSVSFVVPFGFHGQWFGRS